MEDDCLGGRAGAWCVRRRITERIESMSTDNNKATVDRINAAFQDNSVEGFLACCADDVEWTIVGEKAVKGKDAIRAWMGPGAKEPPRFSVARVIGEGDFVAAYGDMTMNENGQQDVPYSYCDVYRFENDKVVELRSYVVKLKAQA